MIAAWSVDRLDRSLLTLLTFLKDLHAKGCDLYLHKQGLDTTTHTGEMMFQMLACSHNSSGQSSSSAAEGRVLGRPRVGAAVEAKVLALRGKGRGMRAIARELRIGNCTVHRIVSAT